MQALVTFSNPQNYVHRHNHWHLFIISVTPAVFGELYLNK